MSSRDDLSGLNVTSHSIYAMRLVAYCQDRSSLKDLYGTIVSGMWLILQSAISYSKLGNVIQFGNFNVFSAA